MTARPTWLALPDASATSMSPGTKSNTSRSSGVMSISRTSAKSKPVGVTFAARRYLVACRPVCLSGVRCNPVRTAPTRSTRLSVQESGTVDMGPPDYGPTAQWSISHPGCTHVGPHGTTPARQRARSATRGHLNGHPRWRPDFASPVLTRPTSPRSSTTASFTVILPYRRRDDDRLRPSRQARPQQPAATLPRVTTSPRSSSRPAFAGTAVYSRFRTSSSTTTDLPRPACFWISAGHCLLIAVSHSRVSELTGELRPGHRPAPNAWTSRRPWACAAHPPSRS